MGAVCTKCCTSEGHIAAVPHRRIEPAPVNDGSHLIGTTRPIPQQPVPQPLTPHARRHSDSDDGDDEYFVEQTILDRTTGTNSLNGSLGNAVRLQSSHGTAPLGASGSGVQSFPHVVALQHLRSQEEAEARATPRNSNSTAATNQKSMKKFALFNAGVHSSSVLSDGQPSLVPSTTGSAANSLSGAHQAAALAPKGDSHLAGNKSGDQTPRSKDKKEKRSKRSDSVNSKDDSKKEKKEKKERKHREHQREKSGGIDQTQRSSSFRGGDSVSTMQSSSHSMGDGILPSSSIHSTPQLLGVMPGKTSGSEADVIQSVFMR